MTNLTYPMLPPPPPHDRRTGLIVFGIFALVIGGLSSCVTILTPLGLLMAGAMPRTPGVPPPDLRSLVSAVVVYGVVAAAFIAGGIASIRARRWARPFMLSVSWTWLLIGVFGMVMWIALLPSMRGMMTPAGGPAPPAAFQDTMIWIMSGVMVVLYLALPAAFILFYRSRHVRTTLEHYDPNSGWADRVPVSVFGLAVALAASALFTLPMIAYGVFPLFGAVLTGPAAIVAIVAVAAVLAVAAYLVFRLRMSGWWLTLLISIVMPVAMIVTFRQIGPVAMYEHLGMPPEQIEAIRDNAIVRGPLVPIATALAGLAGLIYLAALRKFFVASAGSDRGSVTSVS